MKRDASFLFPNQDWGQKKARKRSFLLFIGMPSLDNICVPLCVELGRARRERHVHALESARENCLYFDLHWSMLQVIYCTTLLTTDEMGLKCVIS